MIGKKDGRKNMTNHWGWWVDVHPMNLTTTSYPPARYSLLSYNVKDNNYDENSSRNNNNNVSHEYCGIIVETSADTL